MAQAEGRAQRRGAGGRYTWIWMIIAFLMIGGLMAWLAMSGEQSTVIVVEEEDLGAAGAVAITTDDLVENASGLRGQVVSLAGIQVVSLVGPQAFWIQLPNQNPYLIKLGPELVASGVAVRSGEVVSVSGRIVAMTDSVLAAWQQEGAITDEGQRMEAEYVLGQTFLEAREIERSDAAAEGSAAPEE